MRMRVSSGSRDSARGFAGGMVTTATSCQRSSTMSAQNSFQVSGGGTGTYPCEPVFLPGNGCKYPASAVANGKKENRKWLLSWCCDKAINKVVNEFVRCGCGFQPGRAIRGQASADRRVAAATSRRRRQLDKASC